VRDFSQLVKIEEIKLLGIRTVQSRNGIWIGFEFRGISQFKFKLKFLFDLNLISILIFHGTGCTSDGNLMIEEMHEYPFYPRTF